MITKTDAAVLQSIDPDTLEPIGATKQQVLHRELKGPMSGAHAKFDPTSGDCYNYNLEFGRRGTYRIFKVSAASGKRSILAKIQHPPAYIHSIFLTEHYVISCVWSAYYKAGSASILWKQNMIDAVADFDINVPATWFVVHRSPIEIGGKGLVDTYQTDAFFSFHSVNAYEEPSTSPATSWQI